MKLKVTSIIFVGYLVAVLVASIGNRLGEEYKLHVAKQVFSPIIDVNELAKMDRREMYELISKPEFIEKHREQIQLRESEIRIFSIISISIQLGIMLAIAGLTSLVISRFYGAKHNKLINGTPGGARH